MSQAVVMTNNEDMAPIVAIAQTMTSMMMQIAADMEGVVIWQEVLFACCLGMKGLAEVQSQIHKLPREHAMQELRRVFERAMEQAMFAKRFPSKEAFDAWTKENGIEVETVEHTVDLRPQTKH